MTVKSYDIGPDGKPRLAAPKPDPKPAPEPKRTASGPRWRGCIPASFFATLLIALIPLFILGLVVLSILGTFYGARGLEVPILTPWQILADISAAPWKLALALVAQGALSALQYGSPELAQGDRRWWIGYAIALGLSIWWNWNGYGPILISLGVPWLVAGGLVAAGDIAPEIAAKRRERARTA